MLENLYHLGCLLPDADDLGEANPLNIRLDSKVELYFVLSFDRDPDWDPWLFSGVQAGEISGKREFFRFLFKSKTGNYRSPFPTVEVFKKDLLKGDRVDFAGSKVGKKLLAILKGFPELAGVAELLKTDETLEDAVSSAVENVDRFLLTLRLDGKDLAESPYMAAKVEQESQSTYKDYYTLQKQTSVGRDAICYLSHKRSQEVWGYASVYNCYAAKTEIGSISGGFDFSQTWKNFPVSPDALKTMLKGQDFLEKHLAFKMCGYPYFLLPKWMGGPLSSADPEFIEIIGELTKKSLGKGGQANADRENELLELLANNHAGACFSLVFFHQDKNKFEILATIDDLFPNYNKALLDAIRRVATRDVYLDHKVEDETSVDVRFNFQCVKTIFPENKEEGSFRKEFLDLVRRILMGLNVDEFYLIKAVNALLRRRHNPAKFNPWPALHSICTIELLLEMNLLTNRTPYHARTKTMHERYQPFFSEHQSFFRDGAAVQAVFLMGVLCQKVLNIQSYRANTQPFYNKLNGLKLDPKRLRSIWPEMIAKLHFYGYQYKDLVDTISQSLLTAAEEFDQMRQEECSFYFTLGMNLHLKVHPKKEDEADPSSDDDKESEV